MASLRVLDWNGGYLTFSSSPNSNHQQQSCTGRTLSFLRTKANKNFLTDHKPLQQQQMAQRHRLSVAGAANLGGEHVNKTSNPFNLDHLIPSDHRVCADWKEISKVHPTHDRIVDKEEDKPEKLDQWMRDSVLQIVSNIGEAPFLVHIYNCEDDQSQRNKESSSSSSGIRLVVEKAIAESWPIIKGRWTEGVSPIPNGVILVEELKSKEAGVIMSSGPESDQTPNTNSNSNSNSGAGIVIDSQSQSTSKTWGLLIQAKGLNRTACYILKTCRVQTLSGFCTHFCLVRVECFVENAETQLNNMWLHR
ncbi:hypothetical protein U1Q18_034538 [Sarracenia purpurea var. burkii]